MLALNTRARFRSVGSHGVVVQVGDQHVTVVNETGLRILELLRGGCSDVSELCRSIQSEYDVPGDSAATDVHAYLDQLRALGIVAGER